MGKLDDIIDRVIDRITGYTPPTRGTDEEIAAAMAYPDNEVLADLLSGSLVEWFDDEEA